MDTASRLSIRAAGLADKDAVARLLAESYPRLMRGHYPQTILEPALSIMTRPQDDLLQGGTFFIALRDGMPLGCGGWSMSRPGQQTREEGLAHIRHFAVLPNAIGQGVGAALFERSLFDARAAGAQRIEVFSSLNAEGFYARMGCRPLRQTDLTLAPDVVIAAILMSRQI